MIITAEYLRTHYTGSESTTDTTATECIRAAIGEVESIIGQPVHVRSITWYFTGDGGFEVVFPYTLKVASVVVQYRPSFDEAWETVADTEYVRPVVRAKDGFNNGGSYRVTANIGLADAVNPALLSADFTADYRYEALRNVICEIAEYHFYGSAKTNQGNKIKGVTTVSDSISDGPTRTTRFTELKDRTADWHRRLQPFKKLRTV